MTKSNIVEKNFSRDPDYYHLHAETQLYVADRLAAILAENSGGAVYSILEIGCGTGFLTEKIFAQFPGAVFYITDLSAAMLKFCKRQTQPIRKQQEISAKFAENDIAKTCPEGEYDLIVSSLAFQWIPDLSSVIAQLKDRLKPQGKLIFSTLTAGTFGTVKQKFIEAGVDFPSPGLLMPTAIESACSCFKNVEICHETRTEEFASMLEFLRHIQGTGAGNATGIPLSAANLKKILNREELVSAIYNITYAVCR